MADEREHVPLSTPGEDEELGGEPPCWAHLLDDEGRLPAAEPRIDNEPAGR